MPNLDNYLLFVVASVLLVLTPGPNLLYLISRTLCQGRAAGIVSLAGTTTGFVVHILAAALGLVGSAGRGAGWPMTRCAGRGRPICCGSRGMPCVLPGRRARAALFAPARLPDAPPGSSTGWAC